MTDRKIVITVFGVTGNQGGAVARALSLDSNFEVRGVTRDLNSEKVQELQKCGVTCMSCDFKNVNSICEVLKEVDGCYIVTYTDFSDSSTVKKELEIGRNIVDACVQMNVPHVIYSTQMHSTRLTGVEARHLVAKAEIEEYMKHKFPKTTFFIPCYYENLYDYLAPRRVNGNNFVLEIPVGTTPLDLVSVADIGDVALRVFKNPGQYRDKTLSLCGAKLTISEIAAELSKHLAPLHFKDRPVTLHEYSQFGQPWSVDFANMFHISLKKYQQHTIEGTLEMSPNLQSFGDWVKNNASALTAAFNKL